MRTKLLTQLERMKLTHPSYLSHTSQYPVARV